MDMPMESMQRSWKILHIDDDEDDFILTRSMLAQAQSRKISLDWASSLDEGRDKLHANHYDAVLVDYDLGLVTGIALIRDMVAEGYTAPLILYTGRGSYAVDVEAMQAGATMYLSKSEATPLLLERIIRYAIERKQTERAQVETQERFRAVLEYSMDVAYRRNLVTDRYDYLSPVVEAVLGFSPEEMDALSLEDILSRIHPEDVGNVTAGIQQSVATGSAQMEYRFRRKDGLYRWMADYVTVQYDRNGRPVYRVGNLRDIHGQKQIEQDLRVSEAKFRQIFAVGAVGVQLWNESGELLDVNDAFLQLVGYTRADFDSGRLDWRQLTLPEYHELDERSIWQMREGVIPTPYEKELWHKDGRRVPVLVAVNQLGQNPDGTLTGVAYFFDMTEQRRAVDALRASEERFRLSARAVNGLVYDWNLVTGESFHSQGVEMMLGFSSDISTRNNWWFQNIHPEDFPAASAQLQGYLEGDRGQFEIEYRVRHADGHWTHIWDRGVIQRDENGRAVRIVGFATDITERKNVENALHEYMQRLERSNQDLQDFAFTVSHDLQEPLRKVESFGRLLLRDGAGGLSSEQVDFIHRMQNASERMRAMIEGMLAYSRVSTQANPFEPVDLNQVAHEVLQDYELRIQRSGSRVEVGPLPVIEADPVQMRQLLQNLLENALKYVHPEVKPVVRISSREEPGGFFALRVEDNGIGIDPSHFPGLFKPFFRLHNAAEYDGAGMGLATVRRIVERHAGSVRVESQPGQGSTFIVRLPAKHA